MSDRDRLRTALAAVVAGDPEQIHELVGATHSDLVAAAGELPPLKLHGSAVARALAALLSDSSSERTVQAWASFVRRGYVAQTASAPVHAIVITYEDALEDEIVEAVARMDELGDPVDGRISAEEGAELLALLRQGR